jgi:hypothetical protein
MVAAFERRGESAEAERYRALLQQSLAEEGR